MSEIIGDRYRKIKCLSSNEELRQLTFLVEDTQIPGRKYTAKVYADIENQSQETKFRENVDILSNSVFEKNPGVSKLRDVGEDRYVRYLIFDYVSGESLEQVIEQDGKLNSDEVERLVNEILVIIKPIHEAGFVHADIKPSNIIIRSQDERVVLIDFDAVGKVNDLRSGKTTATAFTSGYAPPEQKLGILVPQNDLYALGMTAIKALTAKSPHLLERRTNGEINLPSNLSLGYRLENVLLALTHEMSKQRYFSCNEVLDALIRTERTERVAPSLDDDCFNEELEDFDTSNDTSWYGNFGIGKIALMFLVFMVGSFAWGYTTMKSFFDIPSSPEIPLVEDSTDNRYASDNPEQIRPQPSPLNNPVQNQQPTDEEIPQNIEQSSNRISIARNKNLKSSSEKDENDKLDNNNSDVPAGVDTTPVSENPDSGHWFIDGRQK